MSLNNFIIDQVTASILYMEGITITSPSLSNNDIASSSDKKEMQEHIILLLNTQVTKEYIDWLKKVLFYCNLSIEQVAILPYSKMATLSSLRASYDHMQQIWTFGISWQAIDIKSIPTHHFEIQQYEDIYCLSLPRIETFFDASVMNNNKRALMYNLKKLFQIP